MMSDQQRQERIDSVVEAILESPEHAVIMAAIVASAENDELTDEEIEYL